MAGSKTNPATESTVDIESLQENLKGLEMEKNMLKEQKERIEAEKRSLEEEKKRNSEEHAQKVKSLEEEIQKLKEQIQQLQDDKSTLEQQTQQSAANAPKTEELEQKITQLTSERDKAVQEAKNTGEQYQEKIKNLKDMLENLQKEKKGIVLNPFITAFLDALASKLSKHYKKEVTPTSIIEDYIIRYNLTEKYSLWFHDWVITEKEAVEIAQKINPAIHTFRDLQQALNIN